MANNTVRTDFIINLGNSITQINTFVQQINNASTTINNIGADSERNGGLFNQIVGGNLASKAISDVISFTGKLADLGVKSVQLAADLQGTTNSLVVLPVRRGLPKKN